MTPRNARKTSEETATATTAFAGGATTATANGRAAPGSERSGRREGGLNRSSGRRFRYPKFCARMRTQCIVCHQLRSYLQGEFALQTTLHIHADKFVTFANRIGYELRAFACEIGLLGIGLRTYGNEFAGRHRHGARNESRNDHARVRRVGARDTDDETRRRKDAVIRTEHRCA